MFYMFNSYQRKKEKKHLYKIDGVIILGRFLHEMSFYTND